LARRRRSALPCGCLANQLRHPGDRKRPGHHGAVGHRAGRSAPAGCRGCRFWTAPGARSGWRL